VESHFGACSTSFDTPHTLPARASKRLLGGRRRTAVPTVYHIGNFDHEQDAADAKQAVTEGFTILKLKVGRADVAEDLEAVRRVREVIGPDVRLYVDVNQAWNRQQARAFGHEAYEHGVTFIEQPLATWDVAGMADLGVIPGVTVAVDESVFDVPQLVAHVVSGRPPGGVVVKLLKAGGVEGTVDLMRLCQSLAVRPFLAGMAGDTSIVSAALLHVAVTTQDLPLGTAITPHFSKHDVTRRPLRVEHGELDVGQLDGPGLGVDVDLECVEALSVPV
jgi:L-alanine-DL-glutamate epimerase-like enolase superfamily enzyme